MKVVAVVSQKGGVGKTTIAFHLAVVAYQAGVSVALLDLDPQSSAATLADWRGEDGPAVVATPHSRLEQTLEQARKTGVDLVIIDTPPSADAAAIAAARASDLVVIPTRASALDLHAIKTTADLIRFAQKPGFVLLNAVPPRAVTLIEDAAVIVESLGLKLAPFAIVDRAAFRHAVANGRTVAEFEPGGKAAAEVADVFEWVRSKVALNQPSKTAGKAKKKVAAK